jgi:hypothetical protein
MFSPTRCPCASWSSPAAMPMNQAGSTGIRLPPSSPPGASIWTGGNVPGRTGGGIRRLVAHRPQLGGGGAREAAGRQNDGRPAHQTRRRHRSPSDPGRVRDAGSSQHPGGPAGAGETTRPPGPLGALQGRPGHPQDGRHRQARLGRHSQGARFHGGAVVTDPLGGSRAVRPRSTGRRRLQRPAQG